ncbi:hypothetical protein GF386_02570 [Candidatus Pacearchaeota archaeon]|nr:hypothetical protein [Candidatus Pacearchaeota archaeon]MBD3283028.1 hypothetical protein [Candidatus Pacearchaeota archaeon]
MSTLDKVMQLKNQGQTDQQILNTLRQEGVSPREIMEAVSQSKIKTEINSQNPQQNQNTSNQSQNPSANQTGNSPQPGAYPAGQPNPTTQQTTSQQQNTPTQQIQSSYQPSTMSQNSGSPQNQQVPQQQNQYPYQQSTMSTQETQETQQQNPQQQTEEYSQYEDYQPPSDYRTQEYPEYQEGYPEYSTTGSTDLETINDIAEQVVEERTASIKRQIDLFRKFREEAALAIEKLNQRLTKIENNFNEMQMAIIKKIGDYGDSINNISKEMRATQESFSKVLDPLTENIRNLKKITKHK